MVAGGGTLRPAQEGGCDPLPCLPSAEAWGPFATLAAGESRSTPRRLEGGVRGGTPGVATGNRTHLVFPKCAVKALRRAGLKEG